MGENSGTVWTSTSKVQRPLTARSWKDSAHVVTKPYNLSSPKPAAKEGNRVVLIEAEASTETVVDGDPMLLPSTQAVTPADAASLLDEQQEKLRELELKLQRFKQNRSDDGNGKDLPSLAAFLSSVSAKISSLDTELEIITQQYGKDSTQQAPVAPAPAAVTGHIPPSVPQSVPQPRLPDSNGTSKGSLGVHRQRSEAVRQASSPHQVQRAISSPHIRARSISRLQSRAGSPTPIATVSEIDNRVRSPSPVKFVTEAITRTGNGTPLPATREVNISSPVLSARPLQSSRSTFTQRTPRVSEVNPSLRGAVSPPPMTHVTDAFGFSGPALAPGLAMPQRAQSPPPTPLETQPFRDTQPYSMIQGSSSPQSPVHLFRDVPGYATPAAASGNCTGNQTSRPALPSSARTAPGIVKDLSSSNLTFPTTAAPSSVPSTGTLSSVPSIATINPEPASVTMKMPNSVITPNMVSRQISTAQTPGASGIPWTFGSAAPPSRSWAQLSSPALLASAGGAPSRASTASSVSNTPLPSTGSSSIPMPPGGGIGSRSLPSGNPGSPTITMGQSGFAERPAYGEAMGGFSGMNGLLGSLSLKPGGLGPGVSSMRWDPATMVPPGQPTGQAPPPRQWWQKDAGVESDAPFGAVGLRNPVMQMPAWPSQAAAPVPAAPAWADAISSVRPSSQEPPRMNSRERSIEKNRDNSRVRRSSRRRRRGDNEEEPDNFAQPGRLAPIDDEEEGLSDNVFRFQEKLGRLTEEDRRFI